MSAPAGADQETNKIAEAFNRISRFSNWVKSSIANCLKFIKNKLTNQISNIAPGEGLNLIICIIVFFVNVIYVIFKSVFT